MTSPSDNDQMIETLSANRAETRTTNVERAIGIKMSQTMELSV